MVVVIVMIETIEIVATPSKEIFEETQGSDIFCVACMMAHRNNEMINLIAKYFSTFLHELTVISSLQSNA